MSAFICIYIYIYIHQVALDNANQKNNYNVPKRHYGFRWKGWEEPSTNPTSIPSHAQVSNTLSVQHTLNNTECSKNEQKILRFRHGKQQH